MKILLFSDIHNDWPALESNLEIEADYYIAAGDQVTWERGLDRCGEILKTRGDKVWVLPGNHETDADISQLCTQYGLNDFHGRQFAVGRWQIAGLGYSSPTPFNTPGEYAEAEMTRRLEPFGGLDPLVLVCHAPPRDTALDQIGPGQHAGSTAVREFLEKWQPAYFFCGHIHEAAGVEIKMGKTRARNLGKKGWMLELD
jgi:Icc-related predicted phosphoesterase